MVFGGALVYSNLQQRSDSVSAAQPARPEQAALSVEHSMPAVVPAQSLPEDSTRVDHLKGTVPAERAHASGQGDTSNLRSVSRRAVVPSLTASVRVSSSANSSPVNRPSVPPQFGPNTNVALPASNPTQEVESAFIPEQEDPGIEPLQRSSAEPSSIHPAPVALEPASQVVVVPVTTTLTVRLSDTLSTDRNRPGDMFQATLASPLVVSGYVLAEAGTTVRGRVASARRAPLLGGQSELSVALTEIDISNGQHVLMQTGARQIKGARSTLINTARMATGAAVGTVTGALNGAAKGAGLTADSALEDNRVGRGLAPETRAAIFPAGAQLTFILVAPLTAAGTRPR